jgi:tetratricopeptide (TPR) repeat protein
LSERDRTYAQEIAVFRKAVQDIAATPEGAAALARFNAGDEVGALAVLDKLRAARDAARQKEVLARFEEVTRLDPDVHWDWIELGRLHQANGQLALARRAAEQAARTAGGERDKIAANVALVAFRKGLAICEVLAALRTLSCNVI